MIMSRIYYVCIPFSTREQAELCLKRNKTELDYVGSVKYQSGIGQPIVNELPEPMPQVGQHYRRVDCVSDVYVLAMTMPGDYALINVSTGWRWSDPVKHISDVFYGQREIFELVKGD